jgi:geranylgeranyl pyrophosphate synthase
MSALADAISEESRHSWSMEEPGHVVLAVDDDPTRAKRVLNWITEFVATASVTAAQRSLFETALVGIERYLSPATEGGGHVPSIELPLAVYEATTGDEEGAVPLAAACALVCLCAKPFDDLADGDRQAHWAGRSGAEMNLAAATMLCALPPLILAQLDIAPMRRLRMQQILAEGLLRISAGQQTDLALTGEHEVTVAAVQAAVVGKTGERFATYCALAAEMAGVTPQAAALFASFGREIGMARQFLSDCHELLFDRECRDLAQGTRTMLIVTHLSELTGGDRPRFLNLIDRARTELQAREEVRRELCGSIAMCKVIFKARLHYGRARAQIELLGIREPGRTRLFHLAGPGSGPATQ